MAMKDKLVAAVWKGRAVWDVSISSRQAVGDDGTGQVVIRMVHGCAFRFVADVT